MVNPYAKNLSTVFKTLGSAVKGNEKAITALAILEEHLKRKTPRSRPRARQNYGINPTDIVRVSPAVLNGTAGVRSENILSRLKGYGTRGRKVSILKKELGICEADLNYDRKWEYITVERPNG